MAIFKLLSSNINAIVGDYINGQLVISYNTKLTLEEAETALNKTLQITDYIKDSNGSNISGKVVILKNLTKNDNAQIETSKIRTV